jgi:hypothetical protein
MAPSSKQLFLATLTILGTACCGGQPPASRFPTAEDALGRMKAGFDCVNGVQGNAKIDSFTPKAGRIRGDLSLMAVNPDRVRFDVVSPFGATLYTLTSDGKQFEMFDLKEKKFLEGPASACNLARLTQVPVPGHALVALLRGEAPVLVHEPSGATLAWEEKVYKILVSSTRSARQEIDLEVHPDDWNKPWQQQRVRVRRVLVAQRGVDLYSAELSDHEAIHRAPPRVDPDGIDPDVPPSGGVCDVEIPMSIRMRVPNTEQDVIIRYKEVKWNPPIVANAFRQPVPGGVRKIFVDCERDAQPVR